MNFITIELRNSHCWVSDALKALLDSSHEPSLPVLRLRSKSEVIPPLLLIISNVNNLRCLTYEVWVGFAIRIVYKLIVIIIWQVLDSQSCQTLFNFILDGCVNLSVPRKMSNKSIWTMKTH